MGRATNGIGLHLWPCCLVVASPESFGVAVGTFTIIISNYFKLSLSLYLAVTLDYSPDSFPTLSMSHFWIWGCRLLDVSPHRFKEDAVVWCHPLTCFYLHSRRLYGVSKGLVGFAGTPQIKFKSPSRRWQCWAKSSTAFWCVGYFSHGGKSTWQKSPRMDAVFILLLWPVACTTITSLKHRI
jgi:hypothetical protein